MISRRHRFHGHRSVSRVRGSAVRLPHLTVFHAANKRGDYRMAVVVSKKISKSAVTRNRIRRRLYEAVRIQKTLDNEPVDVVFVVKDESLATIAADKLGLEVAKALQKITDQR